MIIVKSLPDRGGRPAARGSISRARRFFYVARGRERSETKNGLSTAVWPAKSGLGAVAVGFGSDVTGRHAGDAPWFDAVVVCVDVIEHERSRQR